MLAGPVMAWQEWHAHEDALAAKALTGITPERDATFRAAWRLPLSVLAFLVTALGGWSIARVAASPVARGVSTRLVALLAAGILLADAALLLDGWRFSDAPYALRAATIVWAYPLAGFLVGGSAHRLAEVAERFAAARRA